MLNPSPLTYELEFHPQGNVVEEMHVSPVACAHTSNSKQIFSCLCVCEVWGHNHIDRVNTSIFEIIQQNLRFSLYMKLLRKRVLLTDARNFIVFVAVKHFFPLLNIIDNCWFILKLSFFLSTVLVTAEEMSRVQRILCI